jgi:filamentous hemagglutinin family protein
MGHRASLNHIYRTVWNQALGAMVAVAEHTRGGPMAGSASGSQIFGVPPSAGGFRLGALAVACVWGAACLPALANPTGAVVVHGQATQTTNGNQLTVITQNGAGTKHSAIDWQSFSIPKGSSTYFLQPDANSTVINRVVTNTPSLLFGNLGSNGHVVLVNHTGVTVGAGATVDAASFTASALGMRDADALAGRLRFGSATESGGNVSVQGSVLARSGDVVLIGSQVATGANALVRSPNGSTVLAAGQQVELTGRGLEGISMLVQAPTDSALNLGTLQGDAVGVFAGTLKTTGTIAATAVSTEGGKVVLKAADRAEVGGTVSALGLAGRGGQVHVTGDKVAVLGDALIDVSGERGGGEALIGGGYKGQDARLANARRTSVQAGAKIRADALGSGNGGTVVVWSDQATQFLGTVSARGGLLGGNGGFAEVSGKRFLDYRGKADLGASNGAKGSLLLDPYNLTIGYGGVPVLGDILDSTEPGTDSFITASSLSELLTSANVSLAAINDIEVNRAVTGNHSLTLTAGNEIRLKANINLTVNPSGYGSPVLSTELNLNAGAGGIVGGEGVITVNRLRISSLGHVLLGASSGVFHRVGNLHFVTPTESGRNLEFRNLGDLALQNITSFGAQVSIAVSDGKLQIEGAVDLGPVEGGQDTLTLSASGDIYQAGGRVKATRLDASAQNISLVGYGNLVTSASFSADVNTGTIGFSNDRSIELRDVRGDGLGLYDVAGNVTQAATSSVQVFSADFDVAGDITLLSATNKFRDITISKAAKVQLRSNGDSLAPIPDGGDNVSFAQFTAPPPPENLTLRQSNAESFDLLTNGDVLLPSSVTATAGSVNIETTGGKINMSGGDGVGSVTATGAITLKATADVRLGNLNSESTGDAISVSTGGNVLTFGNVTATAGNVMFETTNGSIDMVGVNGGAKSITAKGSISLKATSGLILGALSSDAAGDAVILVPYKSSDNSSESIANRGFDAQNGSIVLTGGGRWLAYLAMENCDCNRPTINFGNLQANFKQYDAVYGDAVLGSGNGVMDGYNGTLWNMQLSGQTSKVYDGQRAIGFAGLSFVSPQSNSPVVPQTNTTDNLSQAVLVDATVQLDDLQVGTGKMVRLTSPVFSGVSGAEGNNMTVYYGVGDVSGPVGTLLPASPTNDPPSQVQTGPGSILPWLRQQPYGTSEAIVVSYLRNQPTPWPSPLVPTDPVFGQRDRANEGVLVEGEICVR